LRRRWEDWCVRPLHHRGRSPGRHGRLPPDLNLDQKLEPLETLDVTARLPAVKLQQERLVELRVRKRIREDVESGAQKQQREYFLRQQMDAIRKELGENEASTADEYRKKIADAGMPDAVRQQAERELSRFERMNDTNAEASMIRTYLDWLLAVPWSKRSDERLEPEHAREVLDQDHAGQRDGEDRITGVLAVRKLRAERGPDGRRRSGVILTLVGPPGTGKTSIGESIARATGRKFVRDVARRRSRRGGNPRPSPDAHRRAARPSGPRFATPAR
jgi:ATP-dependent Lon protease